MYTFFIKNKIVKLFSVVSFLFLHQTSGVFFCDSTLNFLLLLMCISVILFLFPFMGNKKMKYLLYMNTLLCIMFFFLKNLFLCFVMFELALYPIFFVVLYWGYQIERVQATMYMVGYTLFFSLPGLVFITQSLLTGVTLQQNTHQSTSNIFSLILMFMFLIKVPIFSFHVWLPKAHVEAPTQGSIFLAAVLLKLGGYGVFFVKMSGLGTYLTEMFAFLLAGMGVLWSSMLCLVQTDMKALVAYSSVVHMNLVIIFLLLSNFNSFTLVLVMFSHAVVSSALFCFSGEVFYKTKTRKIFFLAGTPISGVFFTLVVIFFLMNFSPPPTLGAVGEMMIIWGIFGSTFVFIIYIFLIGMLGAFFCIYVIMSMTSSNKNNKNSSPSTKMLVSNLYYFLYNISFFLVSIF